MSERFRYAWIASHSEVWYCINRNSEIIHTAVLKQEAVFVVAKCYLHKLASSVRDEVGP